MNTALLVLAHRMKRCGELNDESISRVNKAIEVFGKLDIDFIISSGWAYKDGCNKCIGDTIRDYLNHTGGIPISKIYVDTNSRDTVGDAYFVKNNIVLPYNVKRLYIVTSSYHVDRAKFIFNHFYAPSIETTVISADDHFGVHEKYIGEQKSLASFVNTFKNVDFSNDEEVFQALVCKHPYYNGEIFPKLYQLKG